VEVTLAERARHVIADNGETHTITLYRGERFEGAPGSPEFRIVRFAEQVIPVQIPQLEDAVTSMEAAPTSSLLRSSDLEKRAELHWRIAVPVMCIVLTLLAVPLSRLRPRQGRYARIWLGVLIYFVYSQLTSAGKVWIERGTIPEVLGLWWVHAVVVVFVLLVLAGPTWFARIRHKA
jgi:lipopolysaccharide export system permease protein